MRWWKKAGLAVVLIVAASALDAFWIEPASLRVHEYAVELSALPPACDGLRVAVLADLHVGAPFRGLDTIPRLLDRVRGAHPGLVLLAGDYIEGVRGGTFVPPDATARSLAPLQSIAPTFAVLGNHDYGFNGATVSRAFDAQGIPMLDDAARAVSMGGCDLWVAGVTDLGRGPHDVRKALAGVPRGAPTLLLTHNPDLLPAVPSSVLLTVAGHTHGGQVQVPIIGWAPLTMKYPEPYLEGLIVEKGRHLFVSTGIGTSMYPVRFGVPPEISVLVLHRGGLR